MIRYLGWIPGKKKDIGKLKKLGVKGNLRYRQGAIEGCEITEEIVENLIKEWKGFIPCVFTAVDENERALPLERQKFWKYE